MASSFPSNADSAQLATDGYSEVILIDSGTTFTIPAGVDSVSVVAIGPGGGSGGVSVTGDGAGGGGGGGLAWINNVSVSEGSTISMVGGGAGSGADSNNASGDSGTSVIVSLSYLGDVDYSGVNLNPFGTVTITSDSALGVMFVYSEDSADSDTPLPFGELDSLGFGGIQQFFDIYNITTKNEYIDLGLITFSSDSLGISRSDHSAEINRDSTEIGSLGELVTAPSDGSQKLFQVTIGSVLNKPATVAAKQIIVRSRAGDQINDA